MRKKVAVALALLIGIAAIFCGAYFVIKSRPDLKPTYRWCVMDVLKNEPYGDVEVFGWIIEEIELFDEYESEYEEKHFIITVIREASDCGPYCCDLAFDYWIGGIAYRKHNSIWNRGGKDNITRNEIRYIDMDWYKTEIIPSAGLVIGSEECEE